MALRPAYILRRGRGLVTLLAGALLAYFLILPLVGLLVGSVRSTPFGAAVWTIDGFRRAFTDPDAGDAARISVLYAGAVTAIGMVLGLYFATVATRVRCRLRAWITPVMIAVFVTPWLFFAVSWTMLGNRNNGLIANGLRAVGADAAVGWFDVRSWQGLIFVSVLKATAVIYLFLLGPVRRVDRSLEDAAVVSGVARVRALFGITLPLLTPALLATALLSLVVILQAFDLPALLGKPVGIEPLSVHIYGYVVEGFEPDWAAASALSLVYLGCIACLVVVQLAIMRGRDFVTLTGSADAVAPAAVGRWRRLVTASIVGYMGIALAAPVAQTIAGSFQGYFGVYTNWTTAHYVEAVSDPAVIRTLRNTLGIAVGGGAMTVACAFTITYVIQRCRGTIAALATFGSWVPLTAPGIVLSVALLWTYLHTPGVNRLYGSSWLLLAALMVATIPLAVRALEGVVAQVAPELEEVARVSGAGWLSAIADVTVRLCSPTLLIVWLLVGMAMAGLLDVPLLLATGDSQTLATLTFALASNGEFAKAAAVYIVFLAVIGLPCGGVALWCVGVKGAGRRPAPKVHMRTASQGPALRAERRGRADARIEVENLSKRFGGNAVLRRFTLDVEAGAIVCLLGPSGCGKTTLLRCVAGLERPDAGRIVIGSTPVVDVVDDVFVPPERRGLGMVFQHYALWPHMSVGANIAYPLRKRGVPRAECDERVRTIAALVGLATKLDERPRQLSGGEQQRVALARALVHEPSALLLDEPLSNLDASLRTRLRTELRALHDRLGTTTIFVTHDQQEAAALADIVAVVHGGRIVQAGTPAEIVERPRTRFVAEFMGFDNFVDAKVDVVRGPQIIAAVPGAGELEVVDASKTFSRGDAVVIAARGETLRVRDVAAGGRGVRGTVRRVVPVGARLELEVAAGDQTLLVRQEGSLRSSYRAGDDVTVEFPTSCALLVARDAGSRGRTDGGAADDEEEQGDARGTLGTEETARGRADRGVRHRRPGRLRWR